MSETARPRALPKRSANRVAKVVATTRKTIEKHYGAQAVYRETKYERERRKRREQR